MYNIKAGRNKELSNAKRRTAHKYILSVREQDSETNRRRKNEKRRRGIIITA